MEKILHIPFSSNIFQSILIDELNDDKHVTKIEHYSVILKFLSYKL